MTDVELVDQFLNAQDELKAHGYYAAPCILGESVRQPVFDILDMKDDEKSILCFSTLGELSAFAVGMKHARELYKIPPRNYVGIKSGN
jgi:hypothetical protein